MTLGCLSLAGLPSSQSLQRGQVPPPDPGHRGSGRVVAQVPSMLEPSSSCSYRGTGRLHQGSTEPMAHRGSGRVAPVPPKVSYRGSGRVVPDPVSVADWA